MLAGDGSRRWQQELAARGGSRRWQQAMAAGYGGRRWQQEVAAEDGSKRWYTFFYFIRTRILKLKLGVLKFLAI